MTFPGDERRGRANRTLAKVSLLAILIWAASWAAAQEGPLLQVAYERLGPALQDNPFGRPIHLESEDRDGRMAGRVYAVIDHPFPSLAGQLRSAAAWCDIAILHLNVKSCVPAEGREGLALFVGRKFYQPPADAHRIDYRFERRERAGDGLSISLSADNGPFGTSDYRILLDAKPLPDGRSFLRLTYAYRYGFLARLGMEGYLTTLGRGKVGFSRLDGGAHEGELVQGTRGAVERNAMRYYLAIEAYLDTLQVPRERRFEARLQAWFDATDEYRRQLYEMPKADYLRYKRLERESQQALREAAAS